MKHRSNETSKYVLLCSNSLAELVKEYDGMRLVREEAKTYLEGALGVERVSRSCTSGYPGYCPASGALRNIRWPFVLYPDSGRRWSRLSAIAGSGATATEPRLIGRQSTTTGLDLQKEEGFVWPEGLHMAE
jgi:hypothetical protein